MIIALWNRGGVDGQGLLLVYLLDYFGELVQGVDVHIFVKELSFGDCCESSFEEGLFYLSGDAG